MPIATSTDLDLENEKGLAIYRTRVYKELIWETRAQLEALYEAAAGEPAVADTMRADLVNVIADARIEELRGKQSAKPEPAPQTAYGVIVVRGMKYGRPTELRMTFTDHAEFDKTLIILGGIKEIEVADIFWGYSIFTAAKAVEDVKFWML